MPKASRNLQACQECRKRKTKCDGARPRCALCTHRKRQCHWSEAPLPGGYKHICFADSLTKDRDVSSSTKPRSSVAQPSVANVHHGSTIDIHAADQPLLPLQQRLLHLFSQTHHAVELCGCTQLDMFKDENITSESRFLLDSILSLSALYVTDAEAKLGSRFDGRHSLMCHHRSRAQTSSRQFSDHPTITTIQANLVLGLCELLTTASSKAWLHIGLAVRMAQALRMRNEYNRRHPPRQRELRRRTFWACVILDRLVAYCTFRTQTIDLALVGIHLPCSETAFAFGHEEPGPRAEDIGRESNTAAESMAMAYFVKTFLLWSPVAQAYVEGGRRMTQRLPGDRASRYCQSEAAMKAWVECLPREMQWSESNLRAHKSLGQVSHFVNMHLLIQHAFFLVHHEYLPQTEDPGIPEREPTLLSSRPLTHQTNPAVIQACLSGAKQVVSMLRLLEDVTKDLEHPPPSMCAGIPMVTAASVLLWVYHCSHQLTLTTEFLNSDLHQARLDVDYLLTGLDSWADTWGMARAWARSARLLDDFYRSKYDHGHEMTQAGAVGNTALDKDGSTRNQGKETESGAASPTPLRDGDGFPDVTMIPQETYYKVRLITGLVLEQPELCKKFLHIRREVPAEALEQQTDPWNFDTDLPWMNDEEFMAASSLWMDFTLETDE